MPLSGNVILMYHSLDESGSPISVSPRRFREQMASIAASQIPVVPLKQVSRVDGCIAITFDDAFANVMEYSIPVLEARRFPATIFAVSGYCGGNNDWPGQPAGIPRLPLMTIADLRALTKSAFSVGAHTCHHPNLNQLNAIQQAAELRGSKQFLEDQLGTRVDEFAYPYGESSPTSRAIVAKEFALACGTSLEVVTAASDPFELPRVDAYYLSRLNVETLFSPAGRSYLGLRRALRRARRSYAA